MIILLNIFLRSKQNVLNLFSFIEKRVSCYSYLCQGGVMRSILFVCLSVCPLSDRLSVCRITEAKALGALKVKIKVWTLAIAPLTWVRLVTSSALQSRKWQLIGMSQWCRSALCGHPLPALTDNWTHGPASRHTIAPISHTMPSYY